MSRHTRICMCVVCGISFSYISIAGIIKTMLKPKKNRKCHFNHFERDEVCAEIVVVQVLFSVKICRFCD